MNPRSLAFNSLGDKVESEESTQTIRLDDFLASLTKGWIDHYNLLNSHSYLTDEVFYCLSLSPLKEWRGAERLLRLNA
jgi:hypothetical protein